MFRRAVTTLALAATVAATPALAVEAQESDNTVTLEPKNALEEQFQRAEAELMRNRWAGEGMLGRYFQRQSPGTRQRKARQAERRRPKGRR